MRDRHPWPPISVGENVGRLARRDVYRCDGEVRQQGVQLDHGEQPREAFVGGRAGAVGGAKGVGALGVDFLCRVGPRRPYGKRIGWIFRVWTERLPATWIRGAP